MVQSHIADKLWALAAKEVVGTKAAIAIYNLYPRWELLRKDNPGLLKWMADNCYNKTGDAKLAWAYMKRYESLNSEGEIQQIVRKIRSHVFCLEHSLCETVVEYQQVRQSLAENVEKWSQTSRDGTAEAKPMSLFYAMMMLSVPVADTYLTAHYRRLNLPKNVYKYTEVQTRKIGILWLAVKSDPSFRCLESFIRSLSKVEEITIYFDDKQILPEIKEGLGPLVTLVAVGDKTNEQVADLINADKIMILINNFWDRLRGLTVFSLRPAPVAVNFMGVPGRYLNSQCIDYSFTDVFGWTQYRDIDHVEKSIVLPLYYQVAFPQVCTEQRSTGPAKIFGIFARPLKMTPVEFDICRRVLKISNDVVIKFICKDAGVSELTDALLSNGILPEYLERVSVDYEGDKVKYYDLLKSLDVCLDTVSHWGALTTGLEVLAAGVPLLSMTGDTMFSNHSVSLLSSCGMQHDLLCDSVDHLVYRATRLVWETDHFTRTCNKLQTNLQKSKLFDIDCRCKQFSDALKLIQERYSAGLLPDDVFVS